MVGPSRTSPRMSSTSRGRYAGTVPSCTGGSNRSSTRTSWPMRATHIGLHYVAHVAVVAGLAAVAEDEDLFAPKHPAGEDRDHARLAVRPLARAIDVGESEHRIFDVAPAGIDAQIVLQR